MVILCLLFCQPIILLNDGWTLRLIFKCVRMLLLIFSSYKVHVTRTFLMGNEYHVHVLGISTIILKLILEKSAIKEPATCPFHKKESI